MKFFTLKNINHHNETPAITIKNAVATILQIKISNLPIVYKQKIKVFILQNKIFIPLIQ